MTHGSALAQASAPIGGIPALRAAEACVPRPAELVGGMISVIRALGPLLPDDAPASDPGVALDAAAADFGVAARDDAANAAAPAGAAKMVAD